MGFGGGVYMALLRLRYCCKTMETLTHLHTHLIINGLHKDKLVSTKLIESYSKLGSIHSSQLVFNYFSQPDSFMYSVLINSYLSNSYYKHSLFLYQQMLLTNIHVTQFVFPSVLRACSALRLLLLGQKVHSTIIKSGFYSDIIVQTSLLSLYGELNDLPDALYLFDQMPLTLTDSVTWTSIISTCVKNGKHIQGLRLFTQMLTQRNKPDAVVIYVVAEACAELGLLKQAKALHGFAFTNGMISNGSSLVAMYGKCGDLYSSEVLFRNIIRPTTSLWTAMIMCYNHNGVYEDALCTFIKMQEAKVQPNAVTLMGVLSSCARLGLLRIGKSTHCYVIRRLVDADYHLLKPGLIDLYSNCGNVRSSKMLFDEIQDKDTVLWNMIISGYARVGMTKEALMLFKQMHCLGTLSDSYTLASVLSACGDICLSEFGNQIHGYTFKTGIFNEFVQNALIDMYSKCGFVSSALVLFRNDVKRDVVTWNSMIGGFSINGEFLEAISLFDQMHMNLVEMDGVTFLLAIQACSNLGHLEKGKWIHHKLIMYGIGMSNDTFIDTALMDLYAKCGNLHMARRVFDTMVERTLVTWTAIIAGYGLHGDVNTAISLFEEMVKSGIKPNEVTFLNILSACSHAGLVEKGKSYFNSMAKDFGINPKSEHFSCVIDLLSRAGDIDEAYRIISTMPFPIDASVWGALLNGCRIHRRIDLIKNILKTLMEIETDDTGYYTLISNIFAEGGEWNKFKTVRSMMTNAGLNKVHGFSAIEVDKRVQTTMR